MDIAPLWVTAGLGIRQHLRTVEQLGRYLLERWPEASAGTAKHRKAREAVLAALEGRETAARARAAFRRAAEEAGIWGGRCEDRAVLNGHPLREVASELIADPACPKPTPSLARRRALSTKPP